MHPSSSGAAVVPFDPADSAFVADPYPTYDWLRREAPAWWYGEEGLWLVSRHADVDALLRDRRLGRVFVPRSPWERFAPWNLVNEHSMLEMEPPEHTRLRRLVAAAFTRGRVERLRPQVAALADVLLDQAAEASAGGEVDLVAALAEPLPVEVIAELLGIPPADRYLLRPWSNAIVELYELRPSPGAEARAVTAAGEFDAYVRALAAERRHRPADDLLSALAVQAAHGEGLTDDELVATAVLLLNAGHEASVNVIGNGVLALLRHPAELARLRADPRHLSTAVDELIRYDTPLSVFQRTVFEDVEVAGQPLEPGARVGLLLGAANRDPEAFADPDGVDVGRAHNPHVGFGAGVHYCLGAPLARVELQEALGRLLARFPDLELAEDPVVRPTFQFRGYRSLRVRLGAT